MSLQGPVTLNTTSGVDTVTVREPVSWCEHSSELRSTCGACISLLAVPDAEQNLCRRGGDA
jgi:hypothetical protein